MAKKKKSWEEYKRKATFNGKIYSRNIQDYSSKKDAKEGAEYIRKRMNKDVIVDKNKTGYFLWIRTRKPKLIKINKK